MAVGMMRVERVALYYAPAASDPLAPCAASWLGRDAASNSPRTQPDLPDMPGITADAARYGFHATLKPPMRLRGGISWEALRRTVAEVAAGIAPFDLPRLEVADMYGFLALREAEACPALQALADACVAGPDGLREPPDQAELARRRRKPLPPAQEAMLTRWGYPYVFSTWFFHMTLTRRLTPAEHARYRPAAEAHFAAALALPRQVADICIFLQSEAGGAFSLAERFPLRG
jgi:hypothetical protein